MEIKYLGLLPYQDALAVMEARHQAIVNDPSTDGTIFVTQHFPTVTMGKRELYSDMLYLPADLQNLNIAFHKIDRGGSVTVHEPGQVVIYPVLNLHKYKLTVRSYVNLLEEAMLTTAAYYGVSANRDAINPGVWVGNNKIGAVGIRILNKVTKHGIAFNVTNSLQTFKTIIPCGIHSRGVTNLSIAASTNGAQQSAINYSDVEKQLAENVYHSLTGAHKLFKSLI